MKFKKAILIFCSVCAAVSIFSGTVNAQNSPIIDTKQYIKADVQSKRIPVGTVMKLKMINYIDTYMINNGDQFSASLLEDIKVKGSVLLPAGSTIRGIVSDVNRAKRISSGAELLLSFDHVVTPVGKLIPLEVNIVNKENLTLDGKITTGTNYFTRVNNNFNQGVDIVSDATSYGNELGESFWKGYPKVVTVPFAATGGALAGTANFIGRSFVDLFRKGDDIIIDNGQVLEVTLVEPLDIPVH